MSANKKPVNITETTIPYILALGGSVIGVAANFIKYLKISSFFFTRKVSIVSLIIETLDNTETALATTGDKVMFGMIIAGVVFSVIALIMALTGKMNSVITFSVLACLPFFTTGRAWIHYAGFATAIVGAAWHQIVG